MGSGMPAGKGIGLVVLGFFLRGELGEECLFLNTDQVYSASQKNNCIYAKGNNILQHKGKKEPSW